MNCDGCGAPSRRAPCEWCGRGGVQALALGNPLRVGYEALVNQPGFRAHDRTLIFRGERITEDQYLEMIERGEIKIEPHLRHPL